MNKTDNSRAFLALGANLGDPLAAFRQARQQLAHHPQVDDCRSSALYLTEPVGGPAGQADYYNAVLEIRTSLSPRALLLLCQQLEQQAGRTRDVHWGPRTLDIDLLLYADRMMDDAELSLPHPRLHERHFVLQPLCDLAPELIHPRLQKSLQQLFTELPPTNGVRPLLKQW